MLKKLDHVGVVVRDIEKAVQLYSTAFGLKPWRRGVVTVAEEGCKMILLPIGADQSIELLQPIGPDYPMGKHLATRGEGLYHASFLVDDVEAEVRQMRARGVTVENVKRVAPPFPIPIKTTWVAKDMVSGAIIELVELLKDN